MRTHVSLVYIFKIIEVFSDKTFVLCRKLPRSSIPTGTPFPTMVSSNMDRLCDSETLIILY